MTGVRCGVATPIARMVPALACSPAVSVSANIIWTWPEASASSAGAPPLNGTCTISTPVIILNISAESVVRVAGAGRSEIHFARICFGVGDELGHGMSRKRGRDEHDMRRLHDAADRLDVADEIEAQMLVKRGVDRITGVDEEQRVAVRRRGDDGLGPKIAAGAGLVFDDEGLAEMVRQPLRDQARGDVGAAARWEWYDDARWRVSGNRGRRHNRAAPRRWPWRPRNAAVLASASSHPPPMEI